jgi:hypothetical protein
VILLIILWLGFSGYGAVDCSKAKTVERFDYCVEYNDRP